MLQDLAFGKLDNAFAHKQPENRDVVICIKDGGILLARQKDDSLVLPSWEQVQAWSGDWERWFAQPGRRYMDLATCPEHGKFLIRVRLSVQPEGTVRVSRLTYEATSEAAQAYARRAEKADPEDQYAKRRRRNS